MGYRLYQSARISTCLSWTLMVWAERIQRYTIVSAYCTRSLPFTSLTMALITVTFSVHGHQACPVVITDARNNAFVAWASLSLDACSHARIDPSDIMWLTELLRSR